MLEIIISILTLTIMEIVLGIDNVIFISLILEDLEPRQRKVLRIAGLAGAFIARVVLLTMISYLVKLDKNALFSIFNFNVTWHNIIMIVGGGFLIYKSISEIHENYSSLENAENISKRNSKKVMFYIILQIIMIDIIFSFDSILTAIGLSNQLMIMISAVVLSMIIMLFFSEFVSKMIDKFPTIKNLALCFLILVGFVLFLDGVHVEVPKNMVYIAIGFGLLVETINLTMHHKKRSEIQNITEMDFNKFAHDYEFMDHEEKVKIREQISLWLGVENKKDA